MSRRSPDFEPIRVDGDARTRGSRVYLRELAVYLHHRGTVLQRFAQQLGILYWARLGHGHRAVPYVTEAGAKRVIAHVRAIQGALYMEGKRFHENNDAIAAIKRRRKAQMMEILKRQQEADSVKRHLTLAIPRADTEDEAQQD